MFRLTFYERQRIELFRRKKLSLRQIAKKLNRNHSVIKHEIENHSSPLLPYRALIAQRIYDANKKKHGKKKLEKPKNKKLKQFVVKKIKEEWSPEQIAGRLKNFQTDVFPDTISHESIYQYIYNGDGRFENLFHHLRTKRPKRRGKLKRRKRNDFSLVKSKISIHDRPACIDLKERVGDWENDSMLFSNQRPTLAVQYERKGMLCRLKKAPDKTAEEHENAVRYSIETLPKELWKSITRDNGTENAKHLETELIFDVPTFFCDGYSSWQKGGVENLNKLIRQYLPRKTDLSKLTDNDIFTIQEKLNNRPRKSLNYLSPNEFIADYLSAKVVQ
jgi:IS30 family transposase